MPFINTAGLTIIGDGSQWFWAMAGFLAIPITGYAIYSQLRAQRSANRVAALLALTDAWWSQQLQRHRLDVLMHYAEGKPGSPPGLQAVGEFFERLALLERLGDVGAEVVWEMWGGAAQLWWRRSAAEIAEKRKASPGLWTRWEALAQAMAARDRGRAQPPFDIYVAGDPRLAYVISDQIERLRLDYEARAGIVPTWPPAQTTQAAEEAEPAQA